MSKWKLAIQSGHAFSWLTEKLVKEGSNTFAEYQAMSSPKIGVEVKNEPMLRRVLDEAEKAGIPALLVEDEGRTEFNGVKTPTVVAFGPSLREDLPPFLKRLQIGKDVD
jgi:peptidyl-tRNA hydrolase, PTH2 family